MSPAFKVSRSELRKLLQEAEETKNKLGTAKDSSSGQQMAVAPPAGHDHTEDQRDAAARNV